MGIHDTLISACAGTREAGDVDRTADGQRVDPRSPGIVANLLEPSDGAVVERWQARLAAGAALDDLIARRLLAKRFRKSPVEPQVAARVARVAGHVVRTGRPLRLLVPFGGYKSPSSPEHPGAGWAEAFAVAGLCELVSPVAALHPAGVVIEFSSDEAVVSRLTGAEPETLRAYRDDFEKILRLVGAHQRRNVLVRQGYVRDSYDPDDLLRRMKARGRRLEREWFPSLAEDEQARLLRSAANNRHGAASPETLRRSVCEHQAYLEIDDVERAHLLFEPATIPIALRRGIPHWLHLGSNRRSATQFWAGYGVADLTGDRPKAHILPPGRAEAVLPHLDHLPGPGFDVAGLARLPVWKAGARLPVTVSSQL